jgi:zinc protease
MKNLSMVLALLLCSGITMAQNKIQFETYELKNGMRVILHHDKSTPIVAVTVSYKVGSKNEHPERTGFAHFFEHLLFEGSENIERGEYMKLVKENGGVLNANTSFDRTFYFEILPANQLELGLWMESERLLHAKIEDVGIETQREVVKEERRQRFDNTPYGSLLDETMSRTFKVHPYGRGVIGSMDHLNAASREEFMDFYKTFYVPENAILSIAGDIDVKQTKAWIEKYFGSIPRGGRPIPRPAIKEPVQTAEVRDTVYDNIQLPAVIHSYKIPALGTPEYYAVDMLTQLLSQGQSSRFQKHIVNEQQKGLFVGAFPFGLEDHGVALMFGIVNSGVGPDELEAAMLKEYDEVRNNLISEQELTKLLNQIENDFVSRNATVQGIAESLSDYWMWQGDPNLINTEIERYRKVTREDIRAAARKYLTPENRVVIYYLPKSAQ